MRDIKFNKQVLFVNCLVPLALLCWDAYHHRLGANPIEFVTHTTGMLTIIFLLISLLITPIKTLTGAHWLIRFRRMLGVFAFFYGSLHLITYLWFDKFFALGTIWHDILKRPFIAIGTASYLLLVPLAITSTNAMVKKLGGKQWQLLHRLVYLATAGGVLHYWMLVKADTRLPIAFAVALAILLSFRLILAFAGRPKVPKPA